MTTTKRLDYTLEHPGRFYLNRTRTGYEPLEAQRVRLDVLPEGDFCIAEVDGRWVVLDAVIGCVFMPLSEYERGVQYSSPEEAIAAAYRYFEIGLHSSRDEYVATVQNFIGRHGLSPRYRFVDWESE